MTNETQPPRDAEPATFDFVGKDGARLGESPVWRAEDRTVWWVDVEGRRLFRSAGARPPRSWPTPEEIGFVQLGAGGEVFVGMETGVFAFHEDEGRFERMIGLPLEGVRFNDACVDAFGRLWAGTMNMGGAGANGTLYIIGADLRLTPVAHGFRTVNGLAWDAGRDRLFVSDSHPSVRSVWTIDAPGGAAPPAGWRRRLFARLEDLPGRPDGAAMDAEGGYWIAGVGGAEIYRFAPDGRLTRRVATPMENPTKLTFAGDGLNEVYLTSKHGQGGGGRLARWRPEGAAVRGAPAYRWRLG